MRLNVRGTEIFVDVEGVAVPSGAGPDEELPSCFVLHGGPGSDHTGFKPHLSPLTDKAQLVYVDQRGCGRSAPAPLETYTLEHNVEDLEAIRQALGLDQAIVFGASYGGMVALAYAQRYPERVSHLILAVTAAHHSFLSQAQANVEARGTEEQKRVAHTLWEGAFRSNDEVAEYYRVMGPLYSVRHDPARTEAALARARRNYLALNQGFGGFLRELDLTPDLARVSAPTLILAARHDWICPVEQSERIARGIPHAEFKVFEKSGHSILADEPQAFIDVVRGFLTYSTRERLNGV